VTSTRFPLSSTMIQLIFCIYDRRMTLLKQVESKYS
jgi:hypothetical protein